MINVAVSGAMGRLGKAIAGGIAEAADLNLGGVHAPGHEGGSLFGTEVTSEPQQLSAKVVVECAPHAPVMDNLRAWHDKGCFVVVGTSGFSEQRLRELKSFWRADGPGCLVVPNFSVGAVLMMHFAEFASPYFDSVEIVERHEQAKPDAPSGTALATAMRIGRHRDDSGKPTGHEIVEGALGGLASGVRVHSLRMKGLLSDQEVAFSNSGETFSILHRSTSYESFVNGALLAIRHVVNTQGVSIGLDSVLGLPPIQKTAK
ncbi:MAG: 4-hydroxy-tetrahydrodipicolinate reductase [Xanthomonadales bacterium]|jgi:4-hydroxy-tetrahydrodipicolinate reductase|nr:4-hydroxy-tetrahydrodipicolinate reductase [Xanthomonadales bacterium]MDH3925640.1 4-hydroxy-tetrahydrodipicolinate reductase [Xanthomonadales bacterium]MDH3940969.1 4-hydroxy-tetrahydrodipicolinate reductase [Xanthomonadales bacterium]MDH4000293.1 4-hydroxy-tetrahydrodipicolinate reductase [Xanthomonadales bacterium]